MYLGCSKFSFIYLFFFFFSHRLAWFLVLDFVPRFELWKSCMWQFVVKKSLKVILLNHWYGKKTLHLYHCILSSLCCRIALSLMVNLCHFQKNFIPTQSLLYTLCNKKEMMCLYFFVDSCCDSHNNELHYVVGFNKGVGSLKMWLH